MVRRRKQKSEVQEKRHYCAVCSKRRIQSQMYQLNYDQIILLQVNAQGRSKWRCIDCSAENRRYGLTAERRS